MKFLYNVSILCCFFGAMVGAQEQVKRHYKVRVLLDQRSEFSDTSWVVTSDKDLTLTDPKEESKKLTAKSHEIQIMVRDGFLYLNGQKFLRSQVLITSQDGHLAYNGNKYHGSFLIIRHNQGALLINVVDLEDYVACVLGTESWPGWPLEVNKVFAIICRSYVISKVRDARRKKRIYDIKNTNADQTYAGIHKCDRAFEAAEQTAGVFLAYKKKPIVAMYDVCCGGVIPAQIEGVNRKEFPYLARKERCSFCKGCKMYAWAATFSASQLEDLFKKKVPGLKKISHVAIHKKDAAGLVLMVELKQKGIIHLFTGKDVQSALKKIKSRCYNVIKKGSGFVFEGRGYGHHMGLCQWGARQMVREGHDYPSILNFYYPGTQLMKLGK